MISYPQLLVCNISHHLPDVYIQCTAIHPAVRLYRRYRTLAEEASGEGGRGTVLQQALSSETGGGGGADAAFYVLLRAADRFHAAHGRWVDLIWGLGLSGGGGAGSPGAGILTKCMGSSLA